MFKFFYNYHYMTLKLLKFADIIAAITNTGASCQLMPPVVAITAIMGLSIFVMEA